MSVTGVPSKSLSLRFGMGGIGLYDRRKSHGVERKMAEGAER